MQTGSNPGPADGFHILPTQLPSTRLTAHAGLVQRGGRVQRRVDLGPVGEQELHTLDAARGAGVTERGAAVDVPSVHLVGRKRQVSWGRGDSSLSRPDARRALLVLSKFSGFLARAEEARGQGALGQKATRVGAAYPPPKDTHRPVWGSFLSRIASGHHPGTQYAQRRRGELQVPAEEGRA